MAKPQKKQQSSTEIESVAKTGEDYFALKMRSGPLPSPETLQKLKDIDPSIPKTILDNFNKESEHRRSMDRRVETRLIAFFIVGILAALIGISIICYTGYVFMKEGHPTQGASIITVAAVGVAGAFLGFRKVRNEKESLQD